MKFWGLRKYIPFLLKDFIDGRFNFLEEQKEIKLYLTVTMC